jgi:hypothetical protein
MRPEYLSQNLDRRTADQKRWNAAHYSVPLPLSGRADELIE